MYLVRAEELLASVSVSNSRTVGSQMIVFSYSRCSCVRGGCSVWHSLLLWLVIEYTCELSSSRASFDYSKRSLFSSRWTRLSTSIRKVGSLADVTKNQNAILPGYVKSNMYFSRYTVIGFNLVVQNMVMSVKFLVNLQGP